MELNDDFFDFVEKNADTDPHTLRLRFSNREFPFPLELAITQIETRRKFSAKLPMLASMPRFIIASNLALEQATCEEVAKFHTTLLLPDDTVADLTAGLGADAFAFALAGHKATACELDATRVACLRHNISLFNGIRMSCMPGDSIEALKRGEINADVLFIDPARRDNGKRLYALSDCLPDVTACRHELLSNCRTLLIKASPMLDVSRTLLDWPETSEIYTVSYKGECKEVLVRYDSEHIGGIKLTAVAIDKDGKQRCFSVNHESYQPIPGMGRAEAGQWLYEPDAAIMKLAPWGALCQRHMELRKLHPDTHLFVSPTRIDELPGRWTMIERVMPMAEAKRELKGIRANIVCRNAGVSADELRKRLKASDGGDLFIYMLHEGNSPRPTLLLTRKQNIPDA